MNGFQYAIGAHMSIERLPVIRAPFARAARRVRDALCPWPPPGTCAGHGVPDRVFELPAPTTQPSCQGSGMKIGLGISPNQNLFYIEHR